MNREHDRGLIFRALLLVAAGGMGRAQVGLGFVVPGTRALGLAASGSEPAIQPTREQVEGRRYPLNPLPGEFLRLVLSRQGPLEVAAAGHPPLPVAMVEAERGKLLRITP